MSTQKWRNPYAPLNKKQGKPVVVPAKATAPTLPFTKAILPLDIRASVSRMRTNIKGISTTIRQMEETMDTLYGAMELFNSFGKSSAKQTEAADNGHHHQHQAKGRTQLAAKDERKPEGEHSNDGGNPLGNIDISQLLNLLQSPLVQSLIQQNIGGSATPASTGSSSTKRKKEG